MFEQAFRNIEDILRKEAGCTTELDYTEQTSWLLFLKYLDGLEQDRATEARLEGRKYAFILDKAPTAEAVEALKARAAPHEGVALKGRVLYFHAPQGFGTSKLPPVIDRTLGVVSTARNWRTVLALMKMADEA